MLQYRQYWDDPQAASEVFVVQLLLILAIGTCFCGQQSFESLRSSTAPWVYAASAWLHSPVGASLITIPAVQTRCLMLLARQTSSIGLGQIWGSAGSLLNTAMQLGLHRSPACLPGTGAFEAELRRRLWATVAELVVQTSIDAGAAPIFSHDDFDCEPPSNIDDDQLHEDAAAAPTPKPLASFTQTTTQILLLQSLPARLEIAKHLNHFRSNGSYSTTLQLHAKLSNGLPPQSMTIVPLSRPSSSAGNEHAFPPLAPSPFQAKLLTLLTQRFLLALHQHFALRAHKDPTFHFSRTACLTTSLVLLSLSKTDTSPTVLAAAVPSSSTCIEDTYALLARRASGTFREGTLRPAIAICLELVALVNYHEHHWSFLALGSDHTSSTEQQLRAIEGFVELARERVRVAGDSFKTHVVFFVILAIVGAVEKGEERMDWLVKAAVKESLDVCLGLLRERLHECGGGMSDIAVSPTETTQRDEVTAECDDSEFSFDPTFPDTGDVMQGLSGAF
ncbi:uncharacterized protein K452DRAFT_317031 [Neofusicoccum parvum]|nr:uncharacterized protein K452DRAFT_317031 [Neofusicoccum parvum]